MGILDAPFVANHRVRENLTGVRANALRTYHNALAGRASSPVDILVVGDSKSEGHGASVLAKRWLDLLRDDLRAKYQPAGVVGGQGYVPAWYASTYTATPTVRWVWSGNTTNNQGSGLGRRVVTLNATGASGTLTFTGTSIDLFFTKMNASANTATIQIDGGTVFTYADPRTSGNPTVSGGKWNSVSGGGGASGPGLLTAGSHTVVVTWASGVPNFEGCMIYNGDESSGVRVWDGSHFGYLAGGMNTNNSWLGAVPLVNPALILVAFGTNDFGGGAVSSAQFKTDMSTLLSNIRTPPTNYGTGAPKAAIGLLMMEERTPAGATPIEVYANYVGKAYDIVAADPTLTICDLTKRMIRADLDTSLHTDGVHFSDKGDRLVADYLGGFLAPA